MTHFIWSTPKTSTKKMTGFPHWILDYKNFLKALQQTQVYNINISYDKFLKNHKEL